MPSVRSIILISVSVFAISLVIACFSMLRDPDSNGMGTDSYGTRAHGFRGLFETLEELGISVVRELPPPSAELPTDQTLAFLSPINNLVDLEPAYLHALHDWIERGGRVVIAPSSTKSTLNFCARCRVNYDDSDSPDVVPEARPEDGEDVETSTQEYETEAEDSEMETPDDDEEVYWDEYVDELYECEPLGNVFTSLGLEGVAIVSTPALRELPEVEEQPRRRLEPKSPMELLRDRGDYLEETWTTTARTVYPVHVQATGSLDGIGELIHKLAVPGEETFSIETQSDEPSGTLSYVDGEGIERQLIAQFKRGEGEIIVIADQHMLTNRFLGRADNSVLAVHLMSPEGNPVVFDEFYHGLSVRGNFLYLLTRPTYAAIFLAILLLVGLWAWREAIFLGPPLADTNSSRRDIGEYVDAMARFFQHGRKSYPFLLNEVRDGVLHEVCLELKLPMTHDVDVVVSTLARRDPERAERLELALAAVDQELNSPEHLNKSITTDLMKRITACL